METPDGDDIGDGPVGELLLMGDSICATSEDWPDYVARFGFDQSHVEALIRVMCDPALHGEDVDQVSGWAPVHAWRALGQLQAEEAVQPLLALANDLEDDDLVLSELPEVLAMIGAPAIPYVAGFAADASNGAWVIGGVLDSLPKIAARDPTVRGVCIAVLAQMLAPDEAVDRLVAGFVISALVDLQASEAIGVIRGAFARDAVDFSIAGDVEEVEIDLGLRQTRATPRPAFSKMFGVESFLEDEDLLYDEPEDEPGDEVLVPVRTGRKIGRNELCPCGSGKKYKKCCIG